MATALSTLINRTRRFIGDMPDEDVLTASVTSNATTITVADGTLYKRNWQIELDQEVLTVAADGTGTSVTVRRGAKGSAAASHVNSTVVLRKPQFYAIEIIDELNNGLDACYPLIYKPISTEYTGLQTGTYEYDIPDMPGFTTPIPYLSGLEIKRVGDTQFLKVRGYDIVRGAIPYIKLQFDPSTGDTLRINGYGQFPHLSAIADTLDDFWPQHAEGLLPLYATSQLTASGEARRVRVDSGAMDSREQATRTGSSMSASNALYQRFQRQLAFAAMPPLGKHVRPTF